MKNRAAKPVLALTAPARASKSNASLGASFSVSLVKILYNLSPL
jgi:hypothetical protein